MENIAKTISIHLICELAREAAGADLTFYPPRVKNGTITIMQKDSNSRFSDAYFISDFSTVDEIADDIRTFSLNLTANLESTSDNMDCHIEIDDLGQLQIVPDSVDTNFVEVTTESDTMLITEEGGDAKQEQGELGQEEEGNVSEYSDEANYENISAEVVLDESKDESFSEEEVINEDAADEETEWIVTYDIPISEALLEESSDELPSNKKIIAAPDLQTAAKYADQQARILAREDAGWKDAEVVGIQKR